MNLSYLYNIDYTRTDVYTQEITIPVADVAGTYAGYSRIYLDHIPKADTLSIEGLVQIEKGLPLSGQFYIDFREEYDYANATGVIICSAVDAGHTFTCHYVPIASRIDAGIVNELIRVGNALDGNVYTKTDLGTYNEKNKKFDNLNLPLDKERIFEPIFNDYRAVHTLLSEYVLGDMATDESLKIMKKITDFNIMYIILDDRIKTVTEYLKNPKK